MAAAAIATVFRCRICTPASSVTRVRRAVNGHTVEHGRVLLVEALPLSCLAGASNFARFSSDISVLRNGGA